VPADETGFAGVPRRAEEFPQVAKPKKGNSALASIITSVRRNQRRPRSSLWRAQYTLRAPVPYARHQLLSQALSDPYYVWMKVKFLGQFLRPKPPDISMADVVKLVTSTPQGPHKFATILSREDKRLVAMDRMNGERCRGANLPFDSSMRRVVGGALNDSRKLQYIL
jgi:hypothetical protein